MAGLEAYRQTWDEKAQGMLIYDGRKMSARDQITCLNFRDLPLA